MKKILIAVLRCIIQAIYPLVKAKRNAVRRLRIFFKKASLRRTSRRRAVTAAGGRELPTHRISRLAGNTMSEKRVKVKGSALNKSGSDDTEKRRFDPKNQALWKDKRVIISACAFVVIITVVLSVSLPGGNNNVYASEASPSGSAGAAEGALDAEYVSLNMSGIQGGITENESAVSTPSESPTPASTPSSTPVPTTEPDVPDLVYECHDPRIIEIQTKLMDLGYMDSDEPNDYYGWGTKFSLELFQRKHGLQIDGIIGPETLSLLFSNDAKPYSVKLNDRGNDVLEIEERLKDLKYLKSAADKEFNEDTEKAVKAFQKRNGLTVDGSVGEKTNDALFSDDAKAAAQPAPPKPTKKPSSGSSGSSGNSGNSDNPGSTGNSGGSVEVGDPDGASVEALIALAKSFEGCKYVGGGKGPDTFDCSGFVYYCLNKIGHKIGYMTSTSWAKCSLPKITKMSDMKPGDIICYKPHHVAIYIGNGEMIDASSSNGKVVQRSCTSDYWKSHFICARRVL